MQTKALLVEDDRHTAALLSLQLTSMGYQVEVAHDSATALEKAARIKPGVVLLDIGLPDQDGVETCRQMRTIEGMAFTPIILVTAMTSVRDKRRGFEAGADDYVTKPFERDDLRRRIESLLERSRRETPVQEPLAQNQPGLGHLWTLRQGKPAAGGPHKFTMFGSGPRVSVVIPTLNEADNLPDVLPWIPDWVSEVVLVDGNSTDGTVEVALSLRPGIKIVMQKKMGKGAALKAGFAAATGDIIVMLDADGSTSPSEIPAFVGALLGGADFAKGSRFLQGGGTIDMPLYRQLGNKAFVMIVRLLFGGNYSDLLYGYNAFWVYVLPLIQVDTAGFEVETLINIRALRAGLKITEVPSFENARMHGMAKLRAIPDGWRVVMTILKEYYSHYVKRVALARRGVKQTDQLFGPLVGDLFRKVLHLWRSREQMSPESYASDLNTIRATYQELLEQEYRHPEDQVLQTYYRERYGRDVPWVFAQEV